jgi:hypothetical protein
MRKILVALMLVCVLGLFARIPPGTKSIAILGGSIGDLLTDDFDYSAEINIGYFIIYGLEINYFAGFRRTHEDVVVVSESWSGGGALYHMTHYFQ